MYLVVLTTHCYRFHERNNLLCVSFEKIQASAYKNGTQDVWSVTSVPNKG